MSSERISTKILALYAAPTAAMSIMHMPAVYILPAFYAKHTQVSLAAIATVLLFGRLFDAISDPLVGYFSDRTRSRFGKRKPWMALGTPLAMVSILYMYTPPASAGTFYFAFWSIVMFMSWTLIDIPKAAWGAELSHDYGERSRIMTARVAFGLVGSVLFMAAPLLLQPWTGNTEIGADILRIAAWTVAISLPVLISLALYFVPPGKHVSTHKVNLWDFVKTAKTNKPFVRYMSAFVTDRTGIGIWLGAFYIYMDTYMGMGDKFPYLLLTAWLPRVVTAPLWARWMARFGKHRVWAVSLFLTIAVIPLALFITPGPAAFMPMMVYAFTLGFTESASDYAPQAILGDVIDYDTLKTGSNKAGSFFAINGLAAKAAVAIGGSIAFYLLSAFEFNVAGGNTDHQNLGLLLAFLVVPPLVRLVAVLTIWGFPIDARRQDIIKRRIESRATRASCSQ